MVSNLRAACATQNMGILEKIYLFASYGRAFLFQLMEKNSVSTIKIVPVACIFMSTFIDDSAELGRK